MNIYELLGQIMSARYGKDVRQSIHDAIEQCYEDATGNPESLSAIIDEIHVLEQKVENLVEFNVEVVELLPVEDIDCHTIYFVKKETEEENDVYDEWMYISDVWEHIGSTDIDLSGYLTTTGDTMNNVVTFTSSDVLEPEESEDMELIISGETHKNLWGKVSQMAKNIRYLLKSVSNINDSLEWKLLASDTLGRDTTILNLDFTPYRELLVYFYYTPSSGRIMVHTLHVLVKELDTTRKGYQIGSYKDATNYFFARIAIGINTYGWSSPAYYCGNDVSDLTSLKIYGKC